MTILLWPGRLSLWRHAKPTGEESDPGGRVIVKNQTSQECQRVLQAQGAVDGVAGEFPLHGVKQIVVQDGPMVAGMDAAPVHGFPDQKSPPGSGALPL